MAPVRLEIAGALLARGQYRSIGSKNSAIKCAHVSARGVWTDLHIQVASDAIRAGCRGRGPDRQAASLLSEELIDKMAEHRLHAHDLWPEEPVAVLVVVCAWLDREIEPSSAVVEHVCVHEPQEGVEAPCNEDRRGCARHDSDAWLCLSVTSVSSCCCEESSWCGPTS